MEWYVYVAQFFGGVFLANALPHLIMGVTGRRFPTPFASPPGRGLSSPMTNVFWSSINLLVAWVLLCVVDVPAPRPEAANWTVAAGGLLMAFALANFFGNSNAER